jgi:hypothetical protein
MRASRRAAPLERQLSLGYSAQSSSSPDGSVLSPMCRIRRRVIFTPGRSLGGL